MAKKTTTFPYLLEIPCEYGSVSIGDKTCRIGLTVSRGDLELSRADKNICGRRLAGRILARSSGGPNQESLPGLDQDSQVDGVFDVKTISINREYLSFGLTFSRADVDTESLAQFPKREGVFYVQESMSIPEGGEEDDE